VVNRYDYDAFGNAVAAKTSEQVENRYRSEWGVFTGPDALVQIEANGPCNYLFANNNPLRFVDPEGLEITVRSGGVDGRTLFFYRDKHLAAIGRAPESWNTLAIENLTEDSFGAGAEAAAWAKGFGVGACEGSTMILDYATLDLVPAVHQEAQYIRKVNNSGLSRLGYGLGKVGVEAGYMVLFVGPGGKVLRFAGKLKYIGAPIRGGARVLASRPGQLAVKGLLGYGAWTQGQGLGTSIDRGDWEGIGTHSGRLAVIILAPAARDAAPSRGVKRPGNVKTPYGPAVQEQSAAALRVRSQIQQGGTVYKGGVLGRTETGASQFLATESPLNPGYAGRYGIPPQNAQFDFIMGGRVRPGAPVITRPAPGISPNPGGGIEGVINSGDLMIDWFHMP